MVRRVVVVLVVVGGGGVVVMTGAITRRTEPGVVVVVTVTDVGSPSSEVAVGVSGPRYGCGTGSGVYAGALDDRGPTPTTAVSTSRIPSAANTNTYQGGRFPSPSVRPSPRIRTPLTDRVRRG
ncbi:hypothetical protein GCM10018954_082920 [Kutzneria kofuensis]